MRTNSNTTARTGFCSCGVPVADHFGPQNEAIGCAAARRRSTDRLASEQSRIDAVCTLLATERLLQRGQEISSLGPMATLPQDEQNEVRFLAVAALNSAHPLKRRVARNRAIARGLEEFRGFIGQVELHPKTRAQMRVVLDGALTTYKATLEGLDPITDHEISQLLGLDRLPDSSPVKRAVERAQESEGAMPDAFINRRFQEVQ